MSALGAIFHRRGNPVERRSLERMRGALKLYGPDRDGLASDGCMGVVWTHGIGFTPQDRLEHQPVQLEQVGWLAFTGRLDHREALCAALGVAAARAPQTGDDELVRLAWERWDARAVEHLYGDYSFVVADAARRRLTAVRGPLHSRPIHYYATPDRVVLASMPKGIFALGDVPRALNDQRIADALVLNYLDRQSSYFKDIYSLPLGHMLVAEPDRLTVTRFYDLSDTPHRQLPRDSDYVEAATELLDAAVASALRCNETPALGLSSGLDSTTLAVTALEYLARMGLPGGKSLLGLTSVPERDWDGRTRAGRAGDESGPVRALMARYPALEVRFTDAAGLALGHGLDEIQAAADMPLRGVGNLHWGLDQERQARADGRRVMLSGISGNATLSFAAVGAVSSGLFRQGRWLEALRQIRRWNKRRGQDRWFGLDGVIGLAVMPSLPRALHVAQARLRPTGSRWERVSAIHPDFARAMRVEERMAEFGYNDSRQPLGDRRKQMARMFDRGNRHQWGTMTMAFEAVSGLQTRDPFGDRKLAEFCYAIPDDQFFKDGIDRRLVRRVMAGRLPDEVLYAPRGVQSADWHVRLKRGAGGFEEELERLADDPSVSAKIDIPRLRAALRALPEQTPLTLDNHPDLLIAMEGFGRALAVARFIRGIEGRNR